MEYANLLLPSTLAAAFVLLMCVASSLAWLDAGRRTAAVPTWHYLQKEIAELSATRDQKTQEVDRLNASLELLRQEQGQLADVRRQREAAQNDLNELLKRLESLDEDRRTVDRVRDELANALTEKSKIDQDVMDLRDEHGRLKTDIERLTGQQAEIERQVTAKLAERETLTAETARATAERDAVIRNVDQLRREGDEAKARLAEATAGLDSARREVDALATSIGQLKADKAKLEEATSAATKERGVLSAELGRLTGERDNRNAELGQVHERLKASQGALAKEEAQLKEVRLQRDALHSEIQMLHKVLASLEGKVGPKTPDDVRDVLGELLEAPTALARTKKPMPFNGEREALAAVAKHLKDQRLNFPARLLNAFHTSIKIADISPLTVLAGISGTGKSELPRQYAWAMGLPFFQLAVQPRWDSPQDLFGFYNYLERRYKPTELAKLMIHLDTKNWPKEAEPYKDRMALVLLDEMNLARVEYYFSEFLSRLEVRRDKDDAPGAEIELDLGRLAGGYRNIVYPVRRLLFVGTMNEDESTQTLSDKVVDRANVLRFPRPKRLAGTDSATRIMPEIDRYLPFSIWDGWHKRDVSDRKVGEWLETVNKHLEDMGRPFGHRMAQAIAAYVANHPNGPKDPAEAMADQLEMRIFPKLRGIAPDDGENRQALERLRDFIKSELHDDALLKGFNEACARDLFSWRGVDRS